MGRTASNETYAGHTKAETAKTLADRSRLARFGTHPFPHGVDEGGRTPMELSAVDRLWKMQVLSVRLCLFVMMVITVIAVIRFARATWCLSKTAESHHV